MDGGIDGGSVDCDGVDVDVVASLFQALSSSPMDDVVVLLWWRWRCGGCSPPEGGCDGGCFETRASSSYIAPERSGRPFPPVRTA